MSMIKMLDLTADCVMEIREIYEKFPERMIKESDTVKRGLMDNGIIGAVAMLSIGGMLMTDPDLVICEESGDMLNLKKRVKELEDEVKKLKGSAL